jgi:GNAT superfamily N-acetyltransferase
MEIKYYTIETIGDLISDPGFARWKNLPVTRHRAISHMHNPRVNPDDKILFIAFDGDEVAGYLGVLGDKVFMDQFPVRIGWLSCFYVDPAFRGKNLSRELFNRVMEAWDNTIFITNMAPETIRFYNKSGLFHEPVFKQGIRGFLRFNLADILPPKRSLFKKVLPLLNAFDHILNSANAIRLLFYKKYRLSAGIRIEYPESIGPETEMFVRQYNRHEWVKRGKPEWDWIMNYPWLLQSGEKDTESNRYYFSSVAKRFYYKRVQFKDEKGNSIAFFILSVRNNHLTVPYFYCISNYFEDACKFLVNTMLEEKISMITTFNKDLSETLERMSTPFILKRPIKRPYLFPKTLDIPGLEFQDGDGDSVFT